MFITFLASSSVISSGRIPEALKLLMVLSSRVTLSAFSIFSRKSFVAPKALSVSSSGEVVGLADNKIFLSS